MRKLALVCVIFVFFSCAKKDEEKSFETVKQQLAEKLVLNDLIVQTPPKIISAKSTIELVFRDPVVPAHLSENTLDENPFTFEPEIEGYARWKSNKVLEFVPGHILSPGIQVQATLHGKILLGGQKNVDDFLFNFKVAEQEVLSLQGDFVPVSDVKNAVMYKGTLTLAQPANLDKIKDDLVIEGPGKKIDIDLKQSEKQNQIEITSETINRKKAGQSFKVQLPSAYTAGNKSWEEEIFLPGIDVFRVLAHMDMTDPDSPQSIYGFRLSEPIKKQTDLSGYIRITPSLDYKLRIKDKYILIEADFIPAQSYTISISRGFPSIFNNQMENDYKEVFFINNIKPEIKWLSRGIYLPSNNKFKLQFKSVNIARATLEITEIFPQNIGFFLQHNVLTDPDVEAERNRYYYAYDYSDLSRVGEEIYSKSLSITSEKNKWIKTELELDPIFKDKKNSAFVVSLRFESSDLTGRCVNNQDESGENTLYFPDENYYDNPAKAGYYYRNGKKNKLLISSNIGLTAKKTINGVHVFAVDILNAQPVTSLTLNLHSRQNKLLETKTTDAAGYIHFEKNGDYILGNNASGIALIKLDHRSWMLNNFDVGGRSLNTKNTDLFIYTDRGVHRPGDMIHLSAIVRVNNRIPPEKQPVLLKIQNPQGQVVHNDRKPCGFEWACLFSYIN